MRRRIAMLVFGFALGAVALAGCAFDSGGYHVVITPNDQPAATCTTDPATGRLHCEWNTTTPLP